MWRAIACGAFVVLFCLSGSLRADFVYTLGDIDGGVYDGVGSVDDVWADPDWIASAIYPASGGAKAFDQAGDNYDIFFTHEFTPPPVIEHAWLQVGLRAETGWWSDILAMEDPSWIRLQDVGWLPLSTDSFEVRTIDLTNVLGIDYRPVLADGQLNVRLADDLIVDYAVLSFGDEPAIADPKHPYEPGLPYEQYGPQYAPEGWTDPITPPPYPGEGDSPSDPDAIFCEDFEDDLSAWQGKAGEDHHGAIVEDPLNSRNNVLTFTELNSSGDIFTTGAAFALDPSQLYEVSFKYLGMPGQGTPGDLGGYAGLSSGFPDSHMWYYGSGSASGALDILEDNGFWQEYSYEFSVPLSGVGSDLHLMFEDFRYSGGVAGDVYFDDICLRNVTIPAPGAILLGGIGVSLVGWLRRRRAL